MVLNILEIPRKEGTGNREQGTGNPPLAPPPPRRGIIDNLWIRIDCIFDFWRCLLILTLVRAIS
ncbi:MAG: hypothetical protein F6K18_04790 [Okeania sp. SIO2C2]|uniref:hypothetical protein n=1 Tax=Okeania sp. SIO2C2 TaxID=2607787 RepID=UPI0013BDACE6|nr:hypothetical protein [Okeania sp. SIO2C2]NEP86190.1 hypothetical protein [Okeania sp. SIO2C2]